MTPNKEKQIKEMADILYEGMLPLKETYGANELASILYEAGYRKQSEGHWIPILGDFTCSVCEEPNEYVQNYCPNCGAKMKRLGGR